MGNIVGLDMKILYNGMEMMCMKLDFIGTTEGRTWLSDKFKLSSFVFE